MRDRFLLLFGISRDAYSWRGVAWLALFYVGAIIFGALMVTPVYNAVIAWNNSSPTELSEYLAGKDFETYFDRARWVFAILILPFFFKVCGFFPYGKIRRLAAAKGRVRAFLGALVAGFHRLGIHCARRDWACFGKWFALGFALAGLIVIGQLIFSPVTLKTDFSTAKLAKTVLGAVASGFALGFFEEIIFRGVIFRCFYTAMRPIGAVLLTSAFFAYAHFRHPDALFASANASANLQAGFEVGFWTLFGIFKSFNWLQFTNLFMFGVLLCVAVLRARSLMSAAGLHAGAVFIMLSYSRNFDIHSPVDNMGRLLWGGPGIVDGIIPLILLTGLTLWLTVPLWKDSAGK